MSVLMFLGTKILGQSNDSIVHIGNGIYTTHQSSAMTIATWSVGVAPKIQSRYWIHSEDNHESHWTQDEQLEFELERVWGRWHNAIGYNPFRQAVYIFNSYRVIEAKIPLEFSVCCEYANSEKEAFFSIGPQTTIVHDKCIISLNLGSPIKEWKPSIGILAIFPFRVEL